MTDNSLLSLELRAWVPFLGPQQSSNSLYAVCLSSFIYAKYPVSWPPLPPPLPPQPHILADSARGLGLHIPDPLCTEALCKGAWYTKPHLVLLISAWAISADRTLSRAPTPGSDLNQINPSRPLPNPAATAALFPGLSFEHELAGATDHVSVWLAAWCYLVFSLLERRSGCRSSTCLISD